MPEHLRERIGLIIMPGVRKTDDLRDKIHEPGRAPWQYHFTGLDPARLRCKPRDLFALRFAGDRAGHPMRALMLQDLEQLLPGRGILDQEALD